MMRRWIGSIVVLVVFLAAPAAAFEVNDAHSLSPGWQSFSEEE